MTPAPKRNHSDHEWTTADEIAFLSKLGTGEYGALPAALPSSRITLLRRYLASCRLRADWLAMDRRRITTAAARMLDHLVTK